LFIRNSPAKENITKTDPELPRRLALPSFVGADLREYSVCAMREI
jgi:hypothetical protein